MKTALIAGCTGLIGQQLLQLLLQGERYSKIVALTRKEIPSHPKLEIISTDFSGLPQHHDKLRVDDVFCCLGTTMAIAKSKEKFFEVDFSYPLELAFITHQQGATQFLIVSALGADKNSSIYYNQVKGQVEEAVSRVDFRTIHIFRPSLLLGPRKETRTGEDAAKIVYKIFGFLIPKKYKGIESIKVARAMLSLAAEESKGILIHESQDLQTF